ncbi:hypothetical protein BH10ACT10_BH10ACT10_02520 [soil metagenome]
MLGPLPPLYRYLVLGVVLGTFVLLGLWVAIRVPAIPTIGLAGAGIGAVAGAVVAFLLLHPHHAQRTR